MAKQVDTRNAEGRGITYTTYDTKVVDWAKAPKTALDNKWKIPDVKQIEKPGEVKYYGAEFKDEASKLNEERYAAYNRRQSNEYIKAGAAAPGEKVIESAVEGEILRQAQVDYGNRRGARGRGGEEHGGIQVASEGSTFTKADMPQASFRGANQGGSFNYGMTPGTAKGTPYTAASFKTATTGGSDEEGFK